MSTIGTGNQIRTILVTENYGLDYKVNEVLTNQLKHHEIIDIKSVHYSNNEYTAVLIIYKVIGI